MHEFKELIMQIEELRETLHKITEGKTLTNQEVVTASQILDVVLNEYYKVLKYKENGG